MVSASQPRGHGFDSYIRSWAWLLIWHLSAGWFQVADLREIFIGCEKLSYNQANIRTYMYMFMFKLNNIYDIQLVLACIIYVVTGG